MGPGTSFHRVLWDDTPPDDKAVRRIVLCSGKVYYDLFEERAKHGIKDVTILRLEQLYPFPAKALSHELKRYPDVEVVWCQEEPKNMGAWMSVAPEIESVLGGTGRSNSRPRYVGRPGAASPATGLLRRHIKEQEKLVSEALTVS
jgi:2-oxoglutarate dehydrogenase E1 component